MADGGRMKLLVHGMQSSGATAFTLFLAQRPDVLALVDIPNNFAAPRVDPPLDMVVKAVITTAYPIDVHVERFRPDRTILLVRDPRANYRSLSTKPYRNHSGLIDEKFAVLEQVYADRHRFDAVIAYEDFVVGDRAVLDTVTALGWPVSAEHLRFDRRHDAILGDLWHHLPDLWGRMDIVFGNVQGPCVSSAFRKARPDPVIDARLATLCPTLLAHYRLRDAASGS